MNFINKYDLSDWTFNKNILAWILINYLYYIVILIFLYRFIKILQRFSMMKEKILLI